MCNCLECEYLGKGTNRGKEYYKCCKRGRIGQKISTIEEELKKPKWCPLEEEKRIEENRKMLTKVFMFEHQHTYMYSSSDFEKEIEREVNYFMRTHDVVNVETKANTLVVNDTMKTVVIYFVTYKA